MQKARSKNASITLRRMVYCSCTEASHRQPLSFLTLGSNFRATHSCHPRRFHRPRRHSVQSNRRGRHHLPLELPTLSSWRQNCSGPRNGDTVIGKPSPFTPYTALKLCELAQAAFPPGVFQVLGGDDRLGPWIVAYPGVRKISFTGSVATGKKVQIAAAAHLKRVSLELYGSVD